MARGRKKSDGWLISTLENFSLHIDKWISNRVPSRDGMTDFLAAFAHEEHTTPSHVYKPAGPKKRSLLGRVLITDRVFGARDQSAPEDGWAHTLLPIEDPKLAGRRSEIHRRLITMREYHFALLYFVLIDSGHPAAGPIGVDEIVNDMYTDGKLSLTRSYEGTQQGTREFLKNECKVDYKRWRERKTTEFSLARRDKRLLEKLSNDCCRNINVLHKAVEQAEALDAFHNGLAADNIKRGHIPALDSSDREIGFGEKLDRIVGRSVTHGELIDIASLGRVNPNELWLTFNHLHDLLDLLVFWGDRVMGFPVPVTRELQETYQREVLRQAPRACDSPIHQGSRAFFAEAIKRRFAMDGLDFVASRLAGAGRDSVH